MILDFGGFGFKIWNWAIRFLSSVRFGYLRISDYFGLFFGQT